MSNPSLALTALLPLLHQKQADGWWLSLVAHEATEGRPPYWSARLEKEGWRTVVVEGPSLADALALVLETVPLATTPLPPRNAMNG